MRTTGPIFSYFKSLVVIIAVLGFCVSCNPRPDEVLKTATSKKVLTNPFSPTGADWPQDHSDISPDSRVHFGRLPNGLRYAILPVADRKGSISIQMNVAAGFNDEPDNAYGVAHVLEHMAFRGARGTKEASVIHDLQTMGARHGRDINGYTMADHTLYFINLNSNDSNTISAALTNMSRLALQPNLTEESLSLEKGVVISEMNLRDSLASRANQSSREFEYPDNKRETVSGIGTVESINGLQLSDVEDFYPTQYQPDNTLLIVTGDVKPRLIKKEISRAFLDWTGGDEEGPNTRERSEIDFSTFPEVATFREKESLSQLNAIENRSSTLQNDTYAYRKKKFSERIASSILKDRLKKRIEEDSTVTWITPFFRREPSYDIRGVRTGANDYIKSVTYFEEERLRALKYGFTGEEIERALETMRAELATKVERSDEIDSSLEAMRFRNSFISGQIYTNYDQNLELFDLFSSELTIESYGNAAKVIWEDFQPRYWSQSTPYIRIPIDKIRGVPKQVLELDIKAHIADKKASFTPSASLEKGRILSRDTLSPGRVKSVLYENGSRLNYQRSSEESGNIVISVTLDGDLNSFIELYSSVGLRATAFSRADIAGISKLDVNSALAGKKADFYVQLDEGKIVISSSTRAKDLDVALSVIATFIADVDYKSEYQQDSFKRTKRRWIHAGKESPMTQAQLYLSWEYSGKSSAFNTLKPSSFSSLDSSELPETIKNLKAIIKEGRIEVGVVGDFNAKALEKAFSNSIGALPKRDAPTQSGIQSDDTIEPLEPGVSSFTHGGPDTQMALSYCWPLSSSSEPDVANIELVNAQVFYNRIVEHFRGELGITYSPRIISQTSSVFPNFRFYCFVVQIDSEKEISTHDEFFDVINDLKTRPVEKVELDRVREPEKSSMDKYGNTNRSLARILASAYSLGIPKLKPSWEEGLFTTETKANKNWV